MLNSSDGLIHKESVTMHGHTILKYRNSVTSWTEIWSSEKCTAA